MAEFCALPYSVPFIVIRSIAPSTSYRTTSSAIGLTPVFGQANVLRQAQRRGEAPAVPVRRAPARRQRPGTLGKQVQVVLGRVADRAVALDRGPGDRGRGVGREHLGDRRLLSRVGGAAGLRPPGGRAGGGGGVPRAHA